MKRILFAIVAMLVVMPQAARAQHSDVLADVLQHAPMTSVFVLKALSNDGFVDCDCDIDNDTPWTELALTALASYAVGAAAAYSLKQMVAERRPDKSDRRSFPSGHTMFAFAGATMLWHEFGHVSPWVTIGGFGVATLTAVDRLVNDRHYLHDVCAGAAIGVAATELSYYLKKKLLKSDNVDVAFTGQQLSVALRW